MMHREIVPGVLTRGECREAIAAAEAVGFEAMGPRYPDDYRNNDRALLDDPELAARLFARLRPHLPEQWVQDGARWRVSGLNSRFRFCRYRDGQSFTRHRDGAWSRTASPSCQLRWSKTIACPSRGATDSTASSPS